MTPCPSMRLRLALLVALLGLAACGGSSDDPPPSPQVPHAPDALGPFAVGHRSFTLIDAARDDRSLLVDLWYPAAPGATGDAANYALGQGFALPSEVALSELPIEASEARNLLVFSHGYRGINTQSSGLLERLASHGFVIAAPEHTGNAQASPDDDFDTAAQQRVPDVRFIIDSLLAQSATAGDPLEGALRAEHIGVLGHSFGGMTAIGTKAGWAGAEADPRVAAIVPMSAVIDGDLQEDLRSGPNRGFAADALARVDVPVLLVGGTDDRDVPVENNGIAFEQLVSAPAVFRLDIVGANHTHFANICAIGKLLLDLGLSEDLWPTVGAEELVEPYARTCGPDIISTEEVTRILARYSVSFFRRYLRGETAYGEFLTEAQARGEGDLRFSARAPE